MFCSLFRRIFLIYFCCSARLIGIFCIHSGILAEEQWRKKNDVTFLCTFTAKALTQQIHWTQIWKNILYIKFLLNCTFWIYSCILVSYCNYKYNQNQTLDFFVKIIVNELKWRHLQVSRNFHSSKILKFSITYDGGNNEFVVYNVYILYTGPASFPCRSACLFLVCMLAAIV